MHSWQSMTLWLNLLKEPSVSCLQTNRLSPTQNEIACSKACLLSNNLLIDSSASSNLSYFANCAPRYSLVCRLLWGNRQYTNKCLRENLFPTFLFPRGKKTRPQELLPDIDKGKKQLGSSGGTQPSLPSDSKRSRPIRHSRLGRNSTICRSQTGGDVGEDTAKRK